MPNTNSEVHTWMPRLKAVLWDFEWVKERYGIDLSSEPQSFLAQYKIWAEGFRTNQNEVLATKQINRNYLEVFLSQRNLAGINTAAMQLGMTTKSFIEAFEHAEEKGYISERESKGEFPAAKVYSLSSIKDFYKRFPRLSKMVFSTYPSFCRLLHRTLEDKFQFEVEPAICATSRKLGEEPLNIGYDIDMLTGEPIGLGHLVWLKTDKPIQLKPDGCSWLTYAQNEDYLQTHIDSDMNNNSEYQNKRNELQR